MRLGLTTWRWGLLALILSLFGVAVWQAEALPPAALLIVLGLVWLTSLMRALPEESPWLRPLGWLRRVPALFALLGVAAGVGVCLGWLVIFQPSAGIALRPAEIWYGLASGYSVLFGLTCGLNAQARAALAARAGWGVSVTITLGTLAFIALGLELGLRYVWVMSDNFAFSKMHQTWHRLYWHPVNEWGYRDVPVAAETQTNLLILGDSLVAGYGMNDIADTFPRLLAAQLPQDHAVNSVAQPGWGISTALGALANYPVQPDVLILSHFINDILEGPAGQQYAQPFPQIRIAPTGATAWWVETFHSANFLYYRAFHYFAVDSAALYNDHVRNAYADDAVWAAYQAEMRAYLDYAQAHNIPLIVLVWPDLLDVAGSQAITQPVVDYFEANGIAVVDMAAHLRAEAPAALVVNPFDAHPGPLSHQRAADALYSALQNP